MRQTDAASLLRHMCTVFTVITFIRANIEYSFNNLLKLLRHDYNFKSVVKNAGNAGDFIMFYLKLLLSDTPSITLTSVHFLFEMHHQSYFKPQNGTCSL